ncbi:MAG TPA: type II toxin-antitoxin system HicA family toxin [Pyrinomonadaceae bacterium]|nr:type II toxin-antitoxin system HicA family toxin [Pyrinomonadaceae bacterium]
MSSEPSLSGKQLIRILSRFGFEVVRIKGSHHFLRHADGRTTVIPVHNNEDIGKGLLRKILSDCDLSVDDLTNN